MKDSLLHTSTVPQYGVPTRYMSGRMCLRVRTYVRTMECLKRNYLPVWDEAFVTLSVTISSVKYLALTHLSSNYTPSVPSLPSIIRL